MLKKSLIAFTFFISALSAAVIEIEIEEKTQKPLKLTTAQINRITATDSSITTIIGNPYLFSIKIDENLGQAFITLKQPIEDPEGMTVITDSGASQDFLVTSQEGEPTIVYLTPPLELVEAYQSSLATIETLSDIFEGKVPQGFGKRDFYLNETIEVGPFLNSVQSISVYEGALENLYVVHIKNLNKTPLSFDKKHFETQSVNWVFSPIKELNRNQETFVVVSKRRD